jgi:excisionase family DNA binding protein
LYIPGKNFLVRCSEKSRERSVVADYLKLPEVARRLDVSEKTARRMVKSGSLPAVFIGGAYRISEEALAEYLENAKVEPGKAQAPPSPEQPSLNGLLEEERRGDFHQSCRRYVQRRAEHYERRLAEAQEGGFFAGHEGSLILLGEALEEYDELGALLAGDLPDLFVEDRSDDAVMRSAVEAAAALRALFKTLERISDRADELAETEAQKAEAAIRREEMRAHTERLSA